MIRLSTKCKRLSGENKHLLLMLNLSTRSRNFSNTIKGYKTGLNKQTINQDIVNDCTYSRIDMRHDESFSSKNQSNIQILDGIRNELIQDFNLDHANSRN